MDEKMRQAIEEKFSQMTEDDWEELREEIASDPQLEEQRRIIEATDISPPNYFSGNYLRFF